MNYKEKSKAAIKNKRLNLIMSLAACIGSLGVGVTSLVDSISFSSEATFTQGTITGWVKKQVQPKNRNANKRTVYFPIVEFTNLQQEQSVFTDELSLEFMDYSKGDTVTVAYNKSDMTTAKVFDTFNHYAQSIIFLALFLMFFIFIVYHLASSNRQNSEEITIRLNDDSEHKETL